MKVFLFMKLKELQAYQEELLPDVIRRDVSKRTVPINMLLVGDLFNLRFSGKGDI